MPLLLMSLSCFAGMVELPNGGSVFVDTDVWNVQKTPFIKKESLMFLHRKDKSLVGHLLDGNIRKESYCGKNKSIGWVVCEKDFPLENKQLSRQFVLQKYISGENYQHYLFVFNFDPKRVSELESLFGSFRKNLGNNK